MFSERICQLQNEKHQLKQDYEGKSIFVSPNGVVERPSSPLSQPPVPITQRPMDWFSIFCFKMKSSEISDLHPKMLNVKIIYGYKLLSLNITLTFSDIVYNKYHCFQKEFVNFRTKYTNLNRIMKVNLFCLTQRSSGET